MLFKFKSKATGDLIMLEPNGRRVLQLIGKTPSASGIIQPSEMQAAVAALEAAIAEEDAARDGPDEAVEPTANDERAKVEADVVSLRRRAVPFIDMLRRAHAANADVVWGV